MKSHASLNCLWINWSGGWAGCSSPDLCWAWLGGLLLIYVFSLTPREIAWHVLITEAEVQEVKANHTGISSLNSVTCMKFTLVI